MAQKGNAWAAIPLLMAGFNWLNLSHINFIKLYSKNSAYELVRIWVHLVFSTKNRTPFLHAAIRQKVFQYIKQNAEKKDIYLDSVNGWSDHAHCLISLNKNLSMSKTAQLIKGESSIWISQNKLTSYKFIWQDDYWAVGVSESHLQAVRNYIFNQEVHHLKKTFVDEVESFMNKYGWQRIKL